VTTWRRIIRGLGVLTIIGTLVVCATPAINILADRLAVNESVKPSGADAIVVLGAGLIHADLLKEESMRRLMRGVELYKQGLAPLVIVLGSGLPGEPSSSEAEVRSRLASAMGIPPDAIIQVETTTTREESTQTASLLRPRDLHRIILVTESLHMRRAKLVFERAGFEVWPGVSANYPAALSLPADRLWLAMRVAQESAALIYYRLAGYI
jgi:uncharacterized SAM-binding protein YcdF (DUF218 family)